VSIARARSNRPGLLLADAPTGNLDDEAGDRVMELLHEVHALGATVIMVTHDPEIGAQADRIIRLRNGVVVEQADQPESKETTQGLTALGRLGGLETLRMGVSSVLRRRLRTTLSAGGVAVGIGAMSFILSFTFGTQNALNSSLSSQGALRQVTVGATGVGGGAGAGGAASVANHKTLDQGALNLLGRQAHVPCKPEVSRPPTRPRKRLFQAHSRQRWDSMSVTRSGSAACIQAWLRLALEWRRRANRFPSR